MDDESNSEIKHVQRDLLRIGFHGDADNDNNLHPFSEPYDEVDQFQSAPG